MRATITFTATRGALTGQRYVFRAPTFCVIGRARDCSIRLPQDLEHLDVSRHHCAFEVAPPVVRVRDLGSRNGTFVNGAKIGQRDGFGTPEPVDPPSPGVVELHEGDEVQLGKYTAFRVTLSTEESGTEVSWPSGTDAIHKGE